MSCEILELELSLSCDQTVPSPVLTDLLSFDPDVVWETRATVLSLNAASEQAVLPHHTVNKIYTLLVLDPSLSTLNQPKRLRCRWNIHRILPTTSDGRCRWTGRRCCTPDRYPTYPRVSAIRRRSQPGELCP
jgi:hypothetical protein